MLAGLPPASMEEVPPPPMIPLAVELTAGELPPVAVPESVPPTVTPLTVHVVPHPPVVLVNVTVVEIVVEPLLDVVVDRKSVV